MITALSISDFVLIDRLTLETRAGFTGLTGETGAGKSIILDALGCVLGMRPAKRFVRAGAKRAVITAEFDVSPGHAVWQMAADAGLSAHEDETLILKRVIPVSGGARAFINDEPVSGALLQKVGEQLVEIHGQHASSNLSKPSYHRDLLDRFAGNDRLLTAYQRAWQDMQAARRECLRNAKLHEEAELAQGDLRHMVDELARLEPQVGEAARLATERAQRMQAGRIVEVVAGALEGLERSDAETMLAATAGALERLMQLPGFDEPVDGELPHALRLAAETFERASIETQEAVASLHGLARHAACDDAALETLEARLFAVKALARKHRCAPDDLPELLLVAREKLARIEASHVNFEAVIMREKEAVASWHSAADALRGARKAAAKRLERVIKKEFEPLKLIGTRLRICVEALDEEAADKKGADGVEIEVETNPGAGFGPLGRIASGGELARLSLALNCALVETSGGAASLIFDEADHGVGGAVAAAIGERFARLAVDRQVFAVTHSPQVAAAADTGWHVEKIGRRKSSKAVGHTRARVLDSQSRLEEIARMLSGSKVTPEARAAAERLLEG